MRGHVSFQSSRMPERGCTDVTLVRSLSSMNAHVNPQVARLRELVSTDPAGVRLETAVHAGAMPIQQLPVLEVLRAGVARQHPVGVDVRPTAVYPERRGRLERLAAVGARVRPSRLLDVHEGDVRLDVRRMLEAETARRADVRARVEVRPLVEVARRQLAELLGAPGMSARIRTLAGVRHEVHLDLVTRPELAAADRTRCTVRRHLFRVLITWDRCVSFAVVVALTITIYKSPSLRCLDSLTLFRLGRFNIH